MNHAAMHEKCTLVDELKTIYGSNMFLLLCHFSIAIIMSIPCSTRILLAISVAICIVERGQQYGSVLIVEGFMNIHVRNTLQYIY